MKNMGAEKGKREEGEESAGSEGSSNEEHDQSQRRRRQDDDDGGEEKPSSSSIIVNSHNSNHPRQNIVDLPAGSERQEEYAQSLNYDDRQDEDPAKLRQQRRRHSFNCMLQISAYAIFGSSLRVFMARFFGRDCDIGGVDDFLTPLSRQICVTATGKTVQTGGAFFVDLPANLLGSFVMGLITPIDIEVYPLKLPWLRRDHVLQNNEVLHQALSVGFCGSLTTYASWNTQMVVMMSGATPLGIQVVPALFGYMIGMMAALQAFRFGRVCSVWLQQHRASSTRRFPDNTQQTSTTTTSFGDVESRISSDCRPSMSLESSLSFWAMVKLFFQAERVAMATAVGLVVAYALVYFISDVSFYRDMFLTAIFTPFGALGRWYLSGWNSRSPESRILGKFPWFPEGTWTANMVGATISALMAAFLDRYFSSNNDDSNASQWISTLLLAIGVGFAGSLSTVSSFVKETTLLAQQFPNGVNAFQYASTTLVCGAMIGICIYTPIVRI